MPSWTIGSPNFLNESRSECNSRRRPESPTLNLQDPSQASRDIPSQHPMTQHVVVLGNGITGATAALRLRELQPDWRITLVSGESDHPFSRPALMYLYMGHLKYAGTKLHEDRVWDDERIERVRAWVTNIDAKGRTLQLHGREPLSFDQLLIATGSKPNKFDWPGQDLKRVSGLYTLMDLQRLYDASPQIRRGVVVGGGLIGIELAEMLHSRRIPVSLLVRESSYWNNVLPPEESELGNRVILEGGLDLRLGTELEEVLDDGDGACGGVRTKDGQQIDCQCVGLTAGVSPNLDLVRHSEIETGRGILVDDSLRTNVEGILAAGDCAEIRRPEGQRNLLQQVWYTGKAQGRVAAEVLAGREASYDPGVWYNSAKFLGLEYQTYGRVLPDLGGQESLFWQEGRQLVRIVHTGGVVTGFNFMGIRARHRVCERWIAEGATLDRVLAEIGQADFDPEFAARLADLLQPVR